jgi:hypothetical protein
MYLADKRVNVYMEGNFNDSAAYHKIIFWKGDYPTYKKL